VILYFNFNEQKTRDIETFTLIRNINQLFLALNRTQYNPLHGFIEKIFFDK